MNVHHEEINRLTRRSYDSEAAIRTYDAVELKWTEGYIFDHFFARPGRVLDLGCGTGRTSGHLATRGHEVIGIDYSEEMIKCARAKFRDSSIRFLVMDAKELAFKDGLFDYGLFSFNGLDNLYPQANRMRALKEVHRVLKAGGLFAFSSHNSLFIPNNIGRMAQFVRTAVRLKVAPYRWSFHEHGPLIMRYISPAQEAKELEQIGFTNVAIISKYSRDIWAITFRDPYPSYVCSKK